MRKLVLAAAALVINAGAAMAADPVEGTWRTEPGDTGGYLHVNISACDQAICGVIRQAFDASGSVSQDYAHLNKRMLWNMQPNGGGDYAGGKIWAPDREKTYNSKMTLSGERLKVSGCVLGICRSQVWTRVK